jgi:hypothetical protein
VDSQSFSVSTSLSTFYGTADTTVLSDSLFGQGKAAVADFSITTVDAHHRNRSATVFDSWYGRYGCGSKRGDPGKNKGNLRLIGASSAGSRVGTTMEISTFELLKELTATRGPSQLT